MSLCYRDGCDTPATLFVCNDHARAPRCDDCIHWNGEEAERGTCERITGEGGADVLVCLHDASDMGGSQMWTHPEFHCALFERNETEDP